MLKVDHVSSFGIRKLRSHRMTESSLGVRSKYIWTGDECVSTSFAACSRLQCRAYLFGLSVYLSVDLDFTALDLILNDLSSHEIFSLTTSCWLTLGSFTP